MRPKGRSSVGSLLLALVSQVVAGAIFAGAAWLVVGSERIAPAAMALVLMVPPTLVSHVLTWLVGKESPEFVIYAVLLSSGLRMFWAVMAVFGLGDLLKEFRTDRIEFGNWMAAVYILGLILQVAFLVAQMNRSHRVEEGR